MNSTRNLLILCGGNSPEHSVSIISALNIFKAVDLDKFNPLLVGLDRQNNFYLTNCLQDLGYDSTIENIRPKNKQKIEFYKSNKGIAVRLFEKTQQIESTKIQELGRELSKDESQKLNENSFLNSSSPQNCNIDVVFPCIHGATGEDGKIQGFLEILGLPYVGNGVLGSVLALDKIVSKTILKSHGIKVVNFLPFHTKNPPIFDECISDFSLPCFAKIANSGSSVGVFKIKNETDFITAMKKLKLLGDCALIEEEIIGQEIECAVIGSSKSGNIQVAPIVGEIKATSNHEFYSYEAKYLDPNGEKLIVPANISESTRQEICKLSGQIFNLLNCEGLARIDFFVRKDSLGVEEIFFNELNTMPGFTNISMFPLLWQKSGKSYSDLITDLVELAYICKS